MYRGFMWDFANGKSCSDMWSFSLICSLTYVIWSALVEVLCAHLWSSFLLDAVFSSTLLCELTQSQCSQVVGSTSPAQGHPRTYFLDILEQWTACCPKRVNWFPSVTFSEGMTSPVSLCPVVTYVLYHKSRGFRLEAWPRKWRCLPSALKMKGQQGRQKQFL